MKFSILITLFSLLAMVVVGEPLASEGPTNYTCYECDTTMASPLHRDVETALTGLEILGRPGGGCGGLFKLGPKCVRIRRFNVTITICNNQGMDVNCQEIALNYRELTHLCTRNFKNGSDYSMRIGGRMWLPQESKKPRVELLVHR